MGLNLRFIAKIVKSNKKIKEVKNFKIRNK